MIRWRIWRTRAMDPQATLHEGTWLLKPGTTIPQEYGEVEIAKSTARTEKNKKGEHRNRYWVMGEVI